MKTKIKATAGLIRRPYPVVLVLLGLIIIGGCASTEQQSSPAEVKEIHPGILEGYLTAEELPDSLALLPPHPEEGTAAFERDKEASTASFAHRDTDRWNQAIKDANLNFPEATEAFSDAVGFRITEEETPRLYLLLHRTLTDVGLSTYAAKNHYARSRPFMVNNEPIGTPDDEDKLRKDGSYPSGHTAIGWAWALILCEVVPEQTDAILARGREFGQSRIICNVHWQSDVDEGRIMGAATVARLHADPVFLADLEAAKSEAAAMRAKCLKPTSNGQTKTDAPDHHSQSFTGEAEILQSWQGDYPVARLDLLPENQREEAVGFISDAKTFRDAWKAFQPGEAVPEIDFNSNLILFARNTQFYNRISIGKVNVTDGVAELLAMETRSAMPIDDKVAISLVEIPGKGVKAIQIGDKNIPIKH